MYALRVIQLAQLALEQGLLYASLALFLFTIKQQQSNAWALAISVIMELPLQLHFAQPAILLAQHALEALPINVFHAAAHCI